MKKLYLNILITTGTLTLLQPALAQQKSSSSAGVIMSSLTGTVATDQGAVPIGTQVVVFHLPSGIRRT